MLKPCAFDSLGAAATKPRTASVRRRDFLIWTTFFAFLDERITVRIRIGADAGIVEKSKEEVGQSAFSIVEQVSKNVKRCRGGDERDRWVGSGLLVAQKQLRRVRGYKQFQRSSEKWKRWRRRSRKLSNGERRHKSGFDGSCYFHRSSGHSL